MPAVVLVHPRLRHRLDDEVDVDRDGVHVRPQGDVDLLGALELGDDRSGLLQDRAELRCLGGIEVGDVDDVALRLDDQRADPERADAVIDEPVLGLVDAAAGRDPVTGEALGRQRPQTSRSTRNATPAYWQAAAAMTSAWKSSW